MPPRSANAVVAAPVLGVHVFPGPRPVLLIHGLGGDARRDWIEPGWPSALAEAGRGMVAVDLPGHGSSPAASAGASPTTPPAALPTVPPPTSPAASSAALPTVPPPTALPAASPPAPPTASAAALSGAISVGAVVAGLASAIEATGQEQADVVGYSLGARLAWSLAATGRVRRLVLGGLRPNDPMAGLDVAALGAVVRGEADPSQPRIARLADLIARADDPDAMLRFVAALGADLFDPAVDVPAVPTLLVAGADDRRLDDLAAMVPAAAYVVVPGDHQGALLSAEFRAAVLDFLA
jgi:pimeloyl-ACP methyl ester carboxylesterase